jgi:hypothetical protein
VEGIAGALGRRVFGFPCNFLGRGVEFYDRVHAEGPFARAGVRYGAVFAPAYLGERFAPRRHALLRRSILLHDVFLARFVASTLPVASARLTIDGEPASFVDAGAEEVDEALALWLCLHEMVHASGPLPLFGARVRKLPLGRAYAAAEEMRADMTAWLMLHTQAQLMPRSATIARDIIMAERLLRSARCGLVGREDRDLTEEVDVEHGALWLGALGEGGGLTQDSSLGLCVDSRRAATVLRELLDELYGVEAMAATDEERGQAILAQHASSLRARFFVRAQSGYRASNRMLRTLDALADSSTWSAVP